jgi:hypothetical protein
MLARMLGNQDFRLLLDRMRVSEEQETGDRELLKAAVWSEINSNLSMEDVWEYLLNWSLPLEDTADYLRLTVFRWWLSHSFETQFSTVTAYAARKLLRVEAVNWFEPDVIRLLVPKGADRVERELFEADMTDIRKLMKFLRKGRGTDGSR